ncbi:zygotic DNA replication licensing factor mcm3-like [Amphibalanus amphitrite]|uniref:zygotic DNA replication licensing factor mcm3-like n=1 Tax=Amphibalanus amphitrite TaxID=1232801 RepID=UPI001C925500|nr:zygotic DNA replication licensing factor mcm3-like [Amphibalanus amphitrite]XP_043235397.1 zygotic DNA replication licensing factor mcm3-like [Amphibalanus amphitrite]XP_043235398.1 zygotic DNA replication licensing factor mcm3-like [Amphibalanus amphitrite]XP_043235399.1 zygotic DNA replication licensing factor mcm3-like [Amphibalanus amphitrite]
MGDLGVIEVDQYLRDIQRDYLDFLDDEEDQGIYMHLVRDMMENQKTRLIVNVNDLRNKLPKRVAGLMKNAFEELSCFQRALMEYAGAADPVYAKQHEELSIGLEGSFGSHHVSPRTLTSKFLGSVVCVEGIVTKCSLVRPKVVKSVHFCPATGKTIERRYTDMTSLDAFPSGSAYPTKDDEGNLLETEFGLSRYKDHQTLTIQEMPEKAPAGQLPRSVDVVCDGDLVDRCKPGDRVQLVGTYRCLPGKQNGFTSGTFRTILIANNVSLLSKEASPTITADDVKLCRKFCKAKRKDVFDLLAHSLAPSIHGHEYIKKALLCLLLGGEEKILPNGTRLRGDINVLLIGDPSVAKSQLLRYVLHTAPRAITTTGRGSSGVGLTAAVTTDQETNERRLEAGAMVLADRGVVCIDEFDKMTDMDRTAIHEVMEQGRVTIAKAGIHAKLNARCSVLAAANPVYGRYDQYKTPMENIGLQDSLLSRFDLLFIVLDTIDAESDRRISDHVVRMHRYRSPNEEDGAVLPLGSGIDLLATASVAEEEEPEKTTIYEKHDPLLHGKREHGAGKIISMNFIRKYIHIAKEMKPKLSNQACTAISEEYSRLRSQDNTNNDMAKTQPITARALETLIRLATAHAKCRLSPTVDMQDAHSAIELLQFAIFKKVDKKPAKSRRRRDDGTDTEGEGDGEEGSERPRAKRPRRQPGEEGYDPYDYDSDEADEEPPTLRSPRPTAGSSAPESMDTAEPAEPVEKAITEERFSVFKTSLQNLLKERRTQTLPMAEVRSYLAEQHAARPFTTGEVEAATDRMMEANQLMVADDQLFLI